MRWLSPEFIRFLVSGAISTGVSYALYLLLLPVMPYLAAFTLSYAAGIAVSYWLSSVFVFRSASGGADPVRFVLVYVVQYLVNGAMLWVLVDNFGVPAELGLIIVIGISVPATFLALQALFPRAS